MAMVIPKGSVVMKKVGIVTIAIALLAVTTIILYRSNQNQSETSPHTKGTLVKEYKEWKKYYI